MVSNDEETHLSIVKKCTESAFGQVSSDWNIKPFLNSIQLPFISIDKRKMLENENDPTIDEINPAIHQMATGIVS